MIQVLHHTRAYFRPLTVRTYALLASGDVLSHFGDLFLMVALPLLVFAKTGSVLATGVGMAVQWVPFGLLAPVAGVLSDSVDRRRLLVLSNLAQTACVGLLPFADQLWLIYLLVGASSVLAAMDESARQAVIPDVLPSDLLAPGLALYQVALRIASMAGPGLAGVLVVTAGPAWAIWVDALTFLLSALLSMNLPLAQSSTSRQRDSLTPALVWGRLLEGIRAVLADDRLFAVLATGAAAGLGIGGMRMLLVALVEWAGWPASYYGYLMGISAAAGVMGVLVGGRLSEGAHRRVIMLLPALYPALLGLVSLIGRSFLLLATVLAAISLYGGAYGIAAGTTIGKQVPSALRGRVGSLRQSVAFTTMSAGAAAAGWAAGHLGPWTAVGLGLGVLVMGAVPLGLRRRGDRQPPG